MNVMYHLNLNVKCCLSVALRKGRQTEITSISREKGEKFKQFCSWRFGHSFSTESPWFSSILQ